MYTQLTLHPIVVITYLTSTGTLYLLARMVEGVERERGSAFRCDGARNARRRGRALLQGGEHV